MILIALDMHGRATVVEPSPIAQGTDSESIVLLSPFPVRCPVMMGWVMPDGSPVEIPLDDTENSPKTRYWNMTNVVLPEGYDGNVQSVWTFKPTANLTAQYGTALACFYAQKPVQSEDPLTHTTIQGYKSLTYNPVEIYVTETLDPIPDGDLDPESPLLEQVLAAITYYNTYLADIEENGVSTVHDNEGEPQREVYTDSEETEDSNNLITSGAVFNAVKSAREYAEEQAESAERDAKSYTDERVQNMPVSPAQEQAIAAAEQRAKQYADGKDTTVLNSAKAYADAAAENAENNAKVAAQGYANTAEQNAKTYTDQQVSRIPKFDIKVVQALPTQDISETTVYLVPADHTETENIYTEYIYVDGNWEILGTQSIDLSGYTTDAELQAALSNYVLTSALQSTLQSYATKTYADNAAAGAEQSAKSYAEQKADEAEGAAKAYADDLFVLQGNGTAVYEDGTFSPTLNIPKIYNDISEVDNTFDKNTTFAQLVKKMSPNSKLVSKCFYGEKDGIVVDTYATLFPRMMDASNDLITIEKKTTEGKEVVSAELSHNKVAVWGGAEISSPSIAVEGSYTYRCPPTPTDNTVYKISAAGIVETLSIDSNGDGTGDPVKWIYAIRWINDFDGTDKGVLLVGADHLNGLYFCRLLNGELQWVAEAAGRTLPQTLIHAVDLHNVICVYTPENKFVLLDENGKLNSYGNETFTNVVSVCGVSEASLYTNAFNFIVSDAQDNLLLYTGNNNAENTATVSLYSSGGITLTDIRLWRFNVLSGKTNGKEKIYNTIALYISGWVLQIIDLPAEHAVDIPVGSEIVSIYALHSGGANVGGFAVAIKDQTTQEVSVLIDGKEAIAGGRVSSGILPTYSLPPAAHMLFTRNADVDRVYWGVNCYFSTIPEVERYVCTTNSGWKQVDIEKEYTDDVGTKVYENGSFSARLDLPKIYASIDEIDSSFDATTTPAQLASAMQSNAELTEVVDTTDYTALVPSGESGKGLLKVYKKTIGANSMSFFGYQGDNKWVGVYDGSFLWKQLANEADLTTAISTITGEISGLETEISSFIRANNDAATEGLTFSYLDNKKRAYCTGGAVSGVVNIPRFVKHDGNWYKVVSISERAFENNTNIVEVIIPDTVISIGSYAFSGCSSLRYIANEVNPDGTYPAIIKNATELFINTYAFSGCPLTSVTLNAPRIWIADYAFYNCTAITDISIDYLSSIGAHVFDGCTSLATIDITNDRALTINDAPSGATVNYYRRDKNPSGKYLHNIKLYSGLLATRYARMCIVNDNANAYDNVGDIYSAISSDADILGVSGYYDDTGSGVNEAGPIVAIEKGSTLEAKIANYDATTTAMVFINKTLAGSIVTDIVTKL